jgi:hypothetical protein
LAPLVAIKVPPSDRDDPERLAYFEPEAKVLASLNLPNIITGLITANRTLSDKGRVAESTKNL